MRTYQENFVIYSDFMVSAKWLSENYFGTQMGDFTQCAFDIDKWNDGTKPQQFSYRNFYCQNGFRIEGVLDLYEFWAF